MAATYYLTVLAETSKIVPAIRRAARAADNITVHPRVDQRQAQRDGREYGSRFQRGFASAAAGIGASLRGVTSGFKMANDSAASVVRHVGSIASVVGIASRMTRGMALSLLGAAGALRLVAGTSMMGIAGGLTLVARTAGWASREITRVTSAILVLAAVGKLLNFMTRAAKMMALFTVGASLAIGVVSALASTLGQVLVGALTLVGSAAGVAAGAIVGILGPAVAVAKIGFKGLTDGAKAFADSMKDSWEAADEAFNKMVGNRMAPMLTAFRELKMSITDTFSAALTPAFANLGTFMDGLRPRAQALTTTLGQIGSELTASLNAPAAQQAFDTMFSASNKFFQNFLGSNGLSGLTTGLLQFAATAANTFSDTGAGINGALQKAGEWLGSIDGAKMKLVFATLKAQIDNVMSVLGPLIGGIRQIGAVTAPALAPGFQAIGSAIREAVPGLVQMAQILMPALSQVMQNLAPVLPALVQAFTPWAGTLATIAPHLATVVANLAPMAPLLMLAVGAVKAIGAAMVITNAVMAAYSVAQGIAAAATGAGTASLGANTIALTAHRVATIAATVASRALGVAIAFATGPIGLVIAAVAAVGTALWAFFTKTETGRQMWEKIWPAIVNAAKVAWEWIKNAFTTAWEAIQPVLQRIGELASTAFSALGNAIKSVWNFVEPAVAAFGRFYAALVKWQFNNVVSALKVLGSVISWLWQSVVTPAFSAIGNVIGLWWQGVKIVWDAATTAIGWVGDKIMWLWQNVTTPAFAAIGSVVSRWWQGVQSVWDMFTGALDKIGTGVGVFKDGIVNAFNAVKDVITTVWGKIGGIWEKIVGGIGTVTNALRGAGGKLLGAVGLDGGARGGVTNNGRVLRRYNQGGQISGPGTGTSDSILGFPAMVRVANGEFITNARTTAEYLPLLQALNAGMPLADVLAQLLPRFAGGGMVSADQLSQFASGVEGAPYVWGGVNWGDCSGAVSAIANYATGLDPFGSRFSTASMDNELAKRGFESGLGPAGSLNIGWYNGGPAGGHTSATLPDGTNFEMGGARGNGQFGGSAVGANDPQYSNHAHLPPEWFDGLDGGSATVGGSYSAARGGGGSYKSATSSQLSSSARKVDSARTSAKNAGQSVDDATYRRDKAQERLDAAKAKGKGVDDAQHSLDVANRELTDSVERQRKAQDRLTEAVSADEELRTKGKYVEGSTSESGGLSGADFGKTFVSGVLESIGLDGSLFSNPLEWPTVKSLMAGVNFAGGLLAGNEQGSVAGPGGFASGIGEAVGLEGLLTQIPAGVANPSAGWTAQSGSPALAPGQFNPATAGGSSLAEGAVNAMSAFAPSAAQHGQGGGAAPGPAGDVNFNGPVGMDPQALRTEMRTELNSRSRYSGSSNTK
ncbi:endolysin [Mycobacterium phage Curiosium]|uniref:Tape measure protein n=1 Tax=Mycobacterium phage Curiosium TaxID=2599859 RepID=A0A5J6TVX9_9CAUD|nr:endolysin [Mycobacterium phage Curiosium]QFG14067.1 tape measure protein [Mycobacterium phage Curiosium]